MISQKQAALQVPYGEEKLKQQKNTVSFKIYLLLHFSSNLLQFLQSNLYTITKKNM